MQRSTWRREGCTSVTFSTAMPVQVPHPTHQVWDQIRLGLLGFHHCSFSFGKARGQTFTSHCKAAAGQWSFLLTPLLLLLFHTYRVCFALRFIILRQKRDWISHLNMVLCTFSDHLLILIEIETNHKCRIDHNSLILGIKNYEQVYKN